MIIFSFKFITMQKKITLLLILALCLSSINLWAQRTPSKNQTFTYTRSPLKPLDNEVKSYHVRTSIRELSANESRVDVTRQMENSIKLYGYERVPEKGDIEILLTLGQDYIKEIHERRKEVKVKRDGKDVTEYKYYYDVEIKYPLSVLITRRYENGSSIIESFQPNNSNDYVYVSTGEFNSAQDRGNWWRQNKEGFILNWKKKQLGENLSAAQRRIENLYAFTPTRVHQSVYAASKRRVDYTDMEQAQQLALAAYAMVNPNDGFGNGYKSKMDEAIQIWKTTLAQLDGVDKKARINHKVAIAIQRNIVTAYCWMGDFNSAYAHNNELANLDKGARWARHLENQIKDRQARIGGLDGDFDFEETETPDDDDDDDE
jgi:hypothetical protein